MSQVYAGLPGNQIATAQLNASTAQSRPLASWQSIGFVLLHIPLAIGMHQVEAATTLHAYIVLALGVLWAAQRRVERVAWVAAYIVGAEVLWRMTSADVFWEFGKYALGFILLIATVRTTQQPPPLLVLLYFVLLIPAAWMTAFLHPLGEARQMISFNMSGPFALFICIWFFQRCVAIERSAFVRLVLVLIAPIVGIASAAAFNTLTATNLTFHGQSNFATSGGFGPNQVSAMLGLGMVGCGFALALGQGRTLRLMLIATFLFLTVQSALTFSRTGLALATIGVAAFIPFILRTTRQRVTVLILLIFFFAFVQVWMIPTLDEFTHGAFILRYTDPSVTHRDEIMKIDLRIWNAHFLFGTGAGGAVAAREFYSYQVAAHTEYTRMLAEHGLLGLMALLALLMLGVRPVLQHQYPNERGVHFSLVFWAFAFMVVSAFRLAAPAFLFGLCWAPLTLECSHPSSHDGSDDE